jgi:hypothetical protein
MGANTKEAQMNKTLRNFWLDVLLYLLLGFNIAAALAIGPQGESALPGTAVHIHAISGMLLTLGSLVHIGMHWRWIIAVLTGKAKGKVKLIMLGMVTIMLLLAGLSGPGAHVSDSVAHFHSLTGSIALIGLLIHGIKRMLWMAITAKRLITHGRHENVIQSA